MQESEHIGAACDRTRRTHASQRWEWAASIALLLIGSASFAPRHALAQAAAPDMRGILPYLALVVDTSASMELLTGCSCTTPGCTECLPDCSLPEGMNPGENAITPANRSPFDMPRPSA